MIGFQASFLIDTKFYNPLDKKQGDTKILTALHHEKGNAARKPTGL